MNALVFHKIEPLASVTKYILVCNNLTQSKPSHRQSRYYFSDPLPLLKNYHIHIHTKSQGHFVIDLSYLYKELVTTFTSNKMKINEKDFESAIIIVLKFSASFHKMVHVLWF